MQTIKLSVSVNNSSNNISISHVSAPSAPEVDRTLYSDAEGPYEKDSLQQSELTNTETKSDDNQGLNTCDRFPFSSRPPQFSLTKSRLRAASPPHQYSQGTKQRSKPSLSNPNVLFCTPDDMTRTIIQ